MFHPLSVNHSQTRFGGEESVTKWTNVKDLKMVKLQVNIIDIRQVPRYGHRKTPHTRYVTLVERGFWIHSSQFFPPFVDYGPTVVILLCSPRPYGPGGDLRPGFPSSSFFTLLWSLFVGDTTWSRVTCRTTSSTLVTSPATVTTDPSIRVLFVSNRNLDPTTGFRSRGTLSVGRTHITVLNQKMRWSS